MTIMEALKWANEQFKIKREETASSETSHDSPMLDAEILLASPLQVQKSWLFNHFDEEIRQHEEEKYKAMIERRKNNEPIAYITEKKEFYSKEFFVNSCVLIPRPATETLVTEALACAKEKETNKTLFADIGTGSGAIAITLAAESSIPVIASDISKKALAVAKTNAKKFQLIDAIDFQHGNLLEPLILLFKKLKGANISPISSLLICANLPYLTEKQMETVQEEVKSHEPRSALAAGADGLEAYWNLFRQLKRSRKLFPQDLMLFIEIDPAQITSIRELILHDFPLAKMEIKKDLEGHDRIVIIKL